MGKFNPAVLLDTAMQHLPDDQLAASVRALEDADIANMVRQEPALRRFVLTTVLDSLAEAGAAAGREHAVAKKRARANGNGKRKSEPAEDTSDQGDDTCAAVLGAVQEAGEEGVNGKTICDELNLAKHVVGHRLRQLVDTKQVRKEGNGRGSRYFAA